jgi:hypothetical protein
VNQNDAYRALRSLGKVIEALGKDPPWGWDREEAASRLSEQLGDSDLDRAVERVE